MQYLTWRQMRAHLNNVTDARLLDEPALFTIMDPWGGQAAYPMELLTESLHASDGTQTLYLSADEEELELEHPQLADDDDDERRPLRTLPPGGLRLGFDETDENWEEVVAWLAQPNPHTPPAVPGPAPLFD